MSSKSSSTSSHSSDSKLRKRSDTILGRLLETYLPDEQQKIAKKQAKKSTAVRNSRRLLKERKAKLRENLDENLKKQRRREKRAENLKTLKSWEVGKEIEDVKERVRTIFPKRVIDIIDTNIFTFLSSFLDITTKE